VAHRLRNTVNREEKVLVLQHSLRTTGRQTGRHREIQFRNVGVRRTGRLFFFLSFLSVGGEAEDLGFFHGNSRFFESTGKQREEKTISEALLEAEDAVGGWWATRAAVKHTAAAAAAGPSSRTAK
jgi:hypothetical protein